MSATALQQHRLDEHHSKGVQLEAYQVLIRPLVTEKGVHRASRNNQFAFEVHKQANKDDVRAAVEAMFEVKVVKVRMQNRKGKPRLAKGKPVYSSSWKKALVTLHPDDSIDLF